MEVLKWLRREGCPWNFLTRAVAKRRGHAEVLKWPWLRGARRGEVVFCFYMGAPI